MNTRYSIYTSVILYIISALSAPAQIFDPSDTNDLSSVYADSIDGIRARSLGIYIEEVATGNVVMDVHGEVPMIPASITKVITSASFFTSGDISESFTTEVFLRGKVADSVLTGDIVIRCDGDPTLESAYFKKQNGLPQQIADSLVGLGISSITGSIVIEEPSWIGTTQPEGWVSEDFTWPYGAGYLPVNYADNVMTVTLSSSGTPTCIPASPGAVFQRKQGRGSAITRRRDTNTYSFTHSGKKPSSIRVANGAPSSSFERAVTDAIEDAGICVSGKPVDSCELRLLLTHYSAPKSEIINSLLVRSDNMMAEAMLRQLTPGKSRKDALEFQRKLWNSRGVSFNDILIEDGSGLSRKNRITPYFMADVLAWMLEENPDFMKFCSYLPLAGKTGTLRNFLKGTHLEGRLRAKTGSMSEVQCYAGYATDRMGVPTHIVVIMVNGFKGDRSSLKKQLEKLLLEKIP